MWNAETGEYQLRGVAYTGNNMREIKYDCDLNKRDGTRKMKSPYSKYAKIGKYFRPNYCMVPRYARKAPKTPTSTPPEAPGTPRGINILTGRPIYATSGEKKGSKLKEPATTSSSSKLQYLKSELPPHDKTRRRM